MHKNLMSMFYVFSSGNYPVELLTEAFLVFIESLTTGDSEAVDFPYGHVFSLMSCIYQRFFDSSKPMCPRCRHVLGCLGATCEADGDLPKPRFGPRCVAGRRAFESKVHAKLTYASINL